MLDPHVGGQMVLQFFYLRPHNILAVCQNSLDPRHERGKDYLLLRFKVNKIHGLFMVHISSVRQGFC